MFIEFQLGGNFFYLRTVRIFWQLLSQREAWSHPFLHILFVIFLFLSLSGSVSLTWHDLGFRCWLLHGRCAIALKHVWPAHALCRLLFTHNLDLHHRHFDHFHFSGLCSTACHFQLWSVSHLPNSLLLGRHQYCQHFVIASDTCKSTSLLPNQSNRIFRINWKGKTLATCPEFSGNVGYTYYSCIHRCHSTNCFYCLGIYFWSWNDWHFLFQVKVCSFFCWAGRGTTTQVTRQTH